MDPRIRVSFSLSSENLCSPCSTSKYHEQLVAFFEKKSDARIDLKSTTSTEVQIFLEQNPVALEADAVLFSLAKEDIHQRIVYYSKCSTRQFSKEKMSRDIFTVYEKVYVFLAHLLSSPTVYDNILQASRKDWNVFQLGLATGHISDISVTVQTERNCCPEDLSHKYLLEQIEFFLGPACKRACWLKSRVAVVSSSILVLSCLLNVYSNECNLLRILVCSLAIIVIGAHSLLYANSSKVLDFNKLAHNPVKLQKLGITVGQLSIQERMTLQILESLLEENYNVDIIVNQYCPELFSLPNPPARIKLPNTIDALCLLAQVDVIFKAMQKICKKLVWHFFILGVWWISCNLEYRCDHKSMLKQIQSPFLMVNLLNSFCLLEQHYTFSLENSHIYTVPAAVVIMMSVLAFLPNAEYATSASMIMCMFFWWTSSTSPKKLSVDILKASISWSILNQIVATVVLLLYPSTFLSICLIGSTLAMKERIETNILQSIAKVDETEKCVVSIPIEIFNISFNIHQTIMIGCLVSVNLLIAVIAQQTILTILAFVLSAVLITWHFGPDFFCTPFEKMIEMILMLHGKLPRSSHEIRDLPVFGKHLLDSEIPHPDDSATICEVEDNLEHAIVSHGKEDPYSFLNRFMGTWKLIKDKSDSMDAVSKAIGVSWIIRRAAETLVSYNIYERLTPTDLEITTLSALNHRVQFRLDLSGAEVLNIDKNIGSWKSKTVVDKNNRALLTTRLRDSDGLEIRESRSMQIENDHGIEPWSDQDILVYTAVVYKAGEGCLAECTRCFSREAGPTDEMWTRASQWSTESSNTEKTSRRKSFIESPASSDDQIPNAAPGQFNAKPLRLVNSLDEISNLSDYCFTRPTHPSTSIFKKPFSCAERIYPI